MRLLIGLNFLWFVVIRTPPDFFGMATSGLEYGEVGCWIRPTARYWFRVVSTYFAKIRLMRCGRDVTDALPPGIELSKGVWKFTVNVPQLFDG